MGATFLQETEATIVQFDLRGFSKMAAELAPLELGIALQAFYEHCEKIVVGQNGRIIKFAGDKVVGAWLGHQLPDHRRLGMDAVAAGVKDTGSLDYAMALASGPVLAGHIGTDSHRQFDLLGEPVNLAAKLTTIATLRGISHVMTNTIPERPSVEIEGIELGGRPIRLFRLA
jgi:adenylate cyclase